MSQPIQSFDYSVNVLRSLLWHYNDAENLQALLQAKQNFYNEAQERFWRDWLTNVFNLETANEFGLSVWSIILDLPLFGQSDQSPDNYPAFGFGPFGLNFNNSNFATDPGSVNRLNLEQRRLILRLRFRQLTTDGSVPDINRIIRDIFGQGRGHVLDNNNMSITYVFTPALSLTLRTVFMEFNVLPRPSGVALIIQ